MSLRYFSNELLHCICDEVTTLWRTKWSQSHKAGACAFFYTGHFRYIHTRLVFITLLGENSRNTLVCSEHESDANINSKNTKRNRVALPRCDTGCAEALFGLKNIACPSQDLLSSLKVFSVWNVEFLFCPLVFTLRFES